MTKETKLFALSEKFLQKYKWKKPPFGFNGLGELVYMRTYSRLKSNGRLRNRSPTLVFAVAH